MTRRALVVSTLLALCVARTADAATIDYPTALARTRGVAPDIAAVRAREAVARSAIGIAGTYPNPTFAVGSSTQTALFSVSASVPLVVFGQIGAGRDAARADLVTARVETDIARVDARTQAAHAFVALWLAAKIADERSNAAIFENALALAVRGRVDVGSAPEIDALRTRAEELRARAEEHAAIALVDAASITLARWIGPSDDGQWRAAGGLPVPKDVPARADLEARVLQTPSVRREQADAQAALARAHHERTLVAPMIALELGVEAWDPTLPTTNYRALLTFDLPLFNHRGSYVEREENAAVAARARADAERARVLADLGAAYARFVAGRERAEALAKDVLPAAELAARAAEDAYALGHASLESVLDAERVRIDTRLAAQQARGEEADAWIDVEHAEGVS